MFLMRRKKLYPMFMVEVDKMTLPSYNAISFHSEEEHQAALYDACLLIVNTYNQTDMLDGYDTKGVTSYDFMKFARRIINNYDCN
jgi:tagatose-1,6-bisphosphate aldolase non-catalytic subunit AgaZ/GatZ